MVFNTLDIIFFIITGLVVIIAAVHGFLYELFSTASLLVSLIISFLFYKEGAAYLEKYFPNVSFLPIIAFLLLFIICYIIIKIIHHLLSGILKNKTLSSFDHALGLFLGILKAAAIIVLIIFILHIQKFFDVSKLLDNSVVHNFMFPFVSHFLLKA